MNWLAVIYASVLPFLWLKAFYEAAKATNDIYFDLDDELFFPLFLSFFWPIVFATHFVYRSIELSHRALTAFLTWLGKRI